MGKGSTHFGPKLLIKRFLRLLEPENELFTIQVKYGEFKMLHAKTTLHPANFYIQGPFKKTNLNHKKSLVTCRWLCRCQLLKFKFPYF
jgi:hypothetical protein